MKIEANKYTEFLDILFEYKLSASELKVMISWSRHAKNYHPTNVQLAKQAKITKANNVSRDLKKLCEKGILLKTSQGHNQYSQATYALTPQFLGKLGAETEQEPKPNQPTQKHKQSSPQEFTRLWLVRNNLSGRENQSNRAAGVSVLNPLAKQLNERFQLNDEDKDLIQLEILKTFCFKGKALSDEKFKTWKNKTKQDWTLILDKYDQSNVITSQKDLITQGIVPAELANQTSPGRPQWMKDREHLRDIS